MPKQISPDDTEEISALDAAAPDGVNIRCKHTGFEARLPTADWDAYTAEQKQQYEILKG